MKRWLVKTEPSAYAYADLEREGRTVWDGVTNNTALIHLRAMKKGDAVFVYHTGREKAVVGKAKVVRGPYPDPAREDERIVVVDLEPAGALPRPVSLATFKTEAAFEGWDLLKNPRLSVMPVPAAMARRLEALAKA